VPLLGPIAMTRFDMVPGLQLARGFYATVVRPLLEEQFSQVPYAAALLGRCPGRIGQVTAWVGETPRCDWC
jgi:hypothetical protein